MMESTGHQLYKEIKQKFIGCPRAFVHVVGDLKAAVLLNQICFWCNMNGKDYTFRDQREWHSEIGLTLKQVQRALKILRQKNLVETSVRLVRNRTITFYTIDWVVLRTLVFEFEECHQSNLPPAKRREKRKDNRSIPGIDKKAIHEQPIRQVPYKWTKSDFLNYSSEVNNSNVSITLKSETSAFSNG